MDRQLQVDGEQRDQGSVHGDSPNLSRQASEPLSWNQFQAAHKGKWTSVKLGRQWRLYKLGQPLEPDPASLDPTPHPASILASRTHQPVPYCSTTTPHASSDLASLSSSETPHSSNAINIPAGTPRADSTSGANGGWPSASVGAAAGSNAASQVDGVGPARSCTWGEPLTPHADMPAVNGQQHAGQLDNATTENSLPVRVPRGGTSWNEWQGLVGGLGWSKVEISKAWNEYKSTGVLPLLHPLQTPPELVLDPDVGEGVCVIRRPHVAGSAVTAPSSGHASATVGKHGSIKVPGVPPLHPSFGARPQHYPKQADRGYSSAARPGMSIPMHSECATTQQSDPSPPPDPGMGHIATASTPTSNCDGWVDTAAMATAAAASAIASARLAETLAAVAASLVSQPIAPYTLLPAPAMHNIYERPHTPRPAASHAFTGGTHSQPDTSAAAAQSGPQGAQKLRKKGKMKRMMGATLASLQRALGIGSRHSGLDCDLKHDSSEQLTSQWALRAAAAGAISATGMFLAATPDFSATPGYAITYEATSSALSSPTPVLQQARDSPGWLVPFPSTPPLLPSDEPDLSHLSCNTTPGARSDLHAVHLLSISPDGSPERNRPDPCMAGIQAGGEGVGGQAGAQDAGRESYAAAEFVGSVPGGTADGVGEKQVQKFWHLSPSAQHAQGAAVCAEEKGDEGEARLGKGGIRRSLRASMRASMDTLKRHLRPSGPPAAQPPAAFEPSPDAQPLTTGHAAESGGNSLSNGVGASSSLVTGPTDQQQQSNASSASEFGARAPSVRKFVVNLWAKLPRQSSSGGAGILQMQREVKQDMDPRIAALPLYGCGPLQGHGHNLRSQAREMVPHNHDRLFQGFGDWIEVSIARLRDVRYALPRSPGVYEWGALPPDASPADPIIAFYLGKAGRLLNAKETLRSRFNAYAGTITSKFVAPTKELEKAALWRELQRRGFTLFLRWRVCLDVEPVELETWLLTQVCYAANRQNNGQRRHMILARGRALSSYPVLHALE